MSWLRNVLSLGSLLLIASTALPTQARELTVSAAASLTEAFTEIAAAYEARQPGVDVILNFGGSGALLQQIRAGAPVDVFAAADEDTMNRASSAGLIIDAERHTFASNLVVLAVTAGSTHAPAALEDLTDPDIERIALGNPDSVPAGRYARQALDDAQLTAALASKLIPAQNVRQALDYLARGEVDAAFVYVTDMAAQSARVRVAFVVPTRAPASYPIAPIAGSKAPAEALGFITFIRSEDAQTILSKHGFRKP